MAPHFSTLAWKILWTEEPERLQSMGSQRVGCDLATEQQAHIVLSDHSLAKNSPTVLYMLYLLVMTSLKVKVKITQSCPTLCDLVDYIVLRNSPEYQSEQPFPFPGNLPNPGIKPRSPALQADSLPSELPAKPHDKPILSNNITDKIIIPTLQMRKGAQRGG